MSDPRIKNLTTTALAEAIHLATSAYTLHLGQCARCRTDRYTCAHAGQLAITVAELATEAAGRTEATMIAIPLGTPNAVPTRVILSSYVRPSIPLNDYAGLRDSDLAFAHGLAMDNYQAHARGCAECEGLRTMIGGGICAEALTLLAPIAEIEAEQAHRNGQAQAAEPAEAQAQAAELATQHGKDTPMEPSQDQMVCRRCGVPVIWWMGKTWKHAAGGGSPRACKRPALDPLPKTEYDALQSQAIRQAIGR